jgi:hypothetical protein
MEIGTFSGISLKVGLKKITYIMGANFGDLGNNGLPNMYLATGQVNFASIIPNRTFKNGDRNVFKMLLQQVASDIQKGHAICFMFCRP